MGSKTSKNQVPRFLLSDSKKLSNGSGFRLALPRYRQCGSVWEGKSSFRLDNRVRLPSTLMAPHTYIFCRTRLRTQLELSLSESNKDLFKTGQSQNGKRNWCDRQPMVVVLVHTMPAQKPVIYAHLNRLDHIEIYSIL